MVNGSIEFCSCCDFPKSSSSVTKQKEFWRGGGVQANLAASQPCISNPHPTTPHPDLRSFYCMKSIRSSPRDPECCVLFLSRRAWSPPFRVFFLCLLLAFADFATTSVPFSRGTDTSRWPPRSISRVFGLMCFDGRSSKSCVVLRLHRKQK